ERKLVTCPVCNSAEVDKMLMAPQLKRTDRQRGTAVPAAAQGAPAAAPAEAASVALMSERERELRAKLAELREYVTRNADYVGQKFAEEARRMHYGET